MLELDDQVGDEVLDPLALDRRAAAFHRYLITPSSTCSAKNFVFAFLDVSKIPSTRVHVCSFSCKLCKIFSASARCRRRVEPSSSVLTFASLVAIRAFSRPRVPIPPPASRVAPSRAIHRAFASARSRRAFVSRVDHLIESTPRARRPPPRAPRAFAPRPSTSSASRPRAPIARLGASRARRTRAFRRDSLVQRSIRRTSPESPP